ncbi:unnamed protein product [Cylindrotheca closterium]|uniref:Uncharacterized protein n=1 Tax=Cylindrotheca closterium TaxID=2856 RepID=A0AAD2CWA4_9STRA|nr:unnamed protein product [Cylindrotheca closterium]
MLQHIEQNLGLRISNGSKISRTLRTDLSSAVKDWLHDKRKPQARNATATSTCKREMQRMQKAQRSAWKDSTKMEYTHDGSFLCTLAPTFTQNTHTRQRK